jgi:osmotically-inducible protein OsmY
MGTKILSFVLMFSFVLTAGVYAQADHAPGSTGDRSLQDVTRAMPTPQDRELNDQVRGALQDDTQLKPALGDVQLKTVNGIVYLKGTVSERDQQRQLEDKIRTLPGVMQVKSFIRVAGHA